MSDFENTDELAGHDDTGIRIRSLFGSLFFVAPRRHGMAAESTEIMPSKGPALSDADTAYEDLIVRAREALARRDADGAIVAIIDAMTRASQRPEAWNLLGAYRELRGDREQAVRAYQTALNLDPSQAAAMLNLARLGAHLPSDRQQPVLG